MNIIDIEEEKEKDAIKVLVRIRPLNEKEVAEGSKSCLILDQNHPRSIFLDTRPDHKQFQFDYVIDESKNQEDIFKIVGRPLSNTCIDGYNVCIFAYGQTGAGKTYTMQGNLQNEKNRGLHPRVLDYLFNQINKQSNIESLVKCSYIEIYNETVRDLLSDNSEQNKIIVREDIQKGVYLDGVSEYILQNSRDALNLLTRGSQQRHVASTEMNHESSRSHSVFTIHIQSKQLVNNIKVVKQSKMHFVDLAGSERQKQTCTSGQQLKEAGNINKSLSCLGNVINALIDQTQGSKKFRHIPYRDSKLTFILKDSLGGNSKTFIIANISAASVNFQETLSTLRFAQVAKQIRNQALINEEAEGTHEFLKLEIKRLKQELQVYQQQSNQEQQTVSSTKSSFIQEEQIMELENLIEQLKMSLSVFQQQNLKLQADLDIMNISFQYNIQEMNELRIDFKQSEEMRKHKEYQLDKKSIQLDEKDQQIKNLLGNIQNRQQKIQQIQSELDQQGSENQELKVYIQEYKQSQISQTYEIDQLKKENEQLSIKNINEKTQYLKDKQQMDSMILQFKQNHLKIVEEDQYKMENLMKIINQTKQENQELTKKSNQQQKNIIELEKQIKKDYQEKINLDIDYALLKDHIQKLQDELKTKTKEIQDYLQSNNIQSFDEHKQLQQRIEYLNQKLQNISKQNDNLKENQNQHITESQFKDHKITELQAKVSELESQQVVDKCEINKLTYGNGDQKIKILNQHKLDLNKAKQEKKQLQEWLTKANDQNTKLKDKIKEWCPYMSLNYDEAILMILNKKESKTKSIQLQQIIHDFAVQIQQKLETFINPFDLQTLAGIQSMFDQLFLAIQEHYNNKSDQSLVLSEIYDFSQNKSKTSVFENTDTKSNRKKIKYDRVTSFTTHSNMNF